MIVSRRPNIVELGTSTL